MLWRIYYDDPLQDYVGENQEDWIKVPVDGVQVIVLYEPPKIPHWTYPYNDKVVTVTDRQLWTGLDVYDPFGWGIKYGSLISDKDYLDIWIRACTDGN